MVRVDIDYVHDDRFIDYEKRFKIRMVSKTFSTAVFAGPRENIKKMLKFHYGDLDEARELHPDVFQNNPTRRNKMARKIGKRKSRKGTKTSKTRKPKSSAKKVSRLKTRIKKATTRLAKLKAKLAKLK